MRTRLWICTAFIWAAAFVIGCASKGRVLNPTVGTTPVLFESDGAREAFSDEIEQRYEAGAAKLPVGTLSKNAFYNQQVQRADLDGDGIISDSEAFRYIKH